MALQSSLTLSSNNAWFKTPATKMLGAFTAGLIAVVILLLSPLTSQSSHNAVNGSSITKQAPATNAASCTADKTQAAGTATFSLMPGRLNRFLQ